MDVAALIIPSFIAGVLTFLAPCTLPLVPGYLGFISGVSLQDLKVPEKAAQARRKIFLNGLFFVIGFSLVFILLGSLAGLGGQTLIRYRVWLARIGGIFVMVFGLLMLGVLKIPFLMREKQFRVPKIFERGRPINSLLFGSAFAFGWTPCVGPILASVLFLASTSATVASGALLLAVFSLGLSMPFLAVAWSVGRASRLIARFSAVSKVISVVGGLFLIFLGALILTNRMGLLISWGYQLLRFINYDRLLDYL